MTTEIATLLAAVVAATVSIISIFINYFLIGRRERSHLVWEREIIRLIELEEKVSSIKHLACGTVSKWDDEYGVEAYEQIHDRAHGYAGDYALMVGRYARYPGIVKKGNRVVNKSIELLAIDKDGGNTDEVYKEVFESYRGFIRILDQTTQRNSLLSDSELRW